MNLHKYLNELVKMTTYNLVGKGAENTFISSAVKVSCTCASATSALSQTLDDWESALSFSLSSVRCLLFRRGIISSTEVAGEAVLVISVLGVAGVAEVTEALLSITRIVLALRLERGSFFLALIRAYIPWLNFVVIPVRGKHLLKKKMKRKGAAWTKLTLTFFFLNFYIAQDEGRGIWTEAVKG